MKDRPENLARDQTMRRFGRFILIGVVNTAVGFMVYAILVVLGISPQLALGIAFVIGVLWNFWTHARFVFHSQGYSPLPVYALCYVGIYAFNAISLAMALRIGLGPLIAQGLIAPVAAVLSFFLISKALTGQFPIIGNS